MSIATWIRDRNGSLYLNQALRYVKGNIAVPQDEPIVTPAATLVAGTLNPGLSPVQIIDSPEDSLSELYLWTGSHDTGTPADVQNRLEVQITDTTWRRRLMNRPILANHVFGTRLRPFRMLKTLFLEAQAVLQLQFSNRSTVGISNFRISAGGTKFQASAMLTKRVTEHIKITRHQSLYLQPYWLTSNEAVTIPAGGSVDAFFDNTRDIYNALFQIMAQAITTGAAGDTQEIFSFEIFDAATERPLQNQPVTMNTGTGTAEFPYDLPTPICMDPRTQLRVRFTNLITDQPTEVFFTFHGVAGYVGPEIMSAQPPEIAPPGALVLRSP